MRRIWILRTTTKGLKLFYIEITRKLSGDRSALCFLGRISKSMVQTYVDISEWWLIRFLYVGTRLHYIYIHKVQLVPCHIDNQLHMVVSCSCKSICHIYSWIHLFPSLMYWEDIQSVCLKYKTYSSLTYYRIEKYYETDMPCNLAAWIRVKWVPTVKFLAYSVPVKLNSRLLLTPAHPILVASTVISSHSER